jgi:hypothetical protein
LDDFQLLLYAQLTIIATTGFCLGDNALGDDQPTFGEGAEAGYTNYMKRLATTPVILLLGLETACSLGLRAGDTPCHSDTVQTSPGVVLFLSSGQTYQVFPSDNRISMTWMPMDKLIVCPLGGSGVEITDATAKGEKVKALRIFNLSWYIWPS